MAQFSSLPFVASFVILSTTWSFACHSNASHLIFNVIYIWLSKFNDSWLRRARAVERVIPWCDRAASSKSSKSIASAFADSKRLTVFGSRRPNRVGNVFAEVRTAVRRCDCLFTAIVGVGTCIFHRCVMWRHVPTDVWFHVGDDCRHKTRTCSQCFSDIAVVLCYY